MELEQTRHTSKTEHTTSRNVLRQQPKLTLFVGVLLFLGIVRLIGAATNTTSTPSHAITAQVDATHTRRPTAVPLATYPSHPSPLPKQFPVAAKLTPMETGKYYQTSDLYCSWSKCFSTAPSETASYLTQANTISGYPGMTKVLLNASLQTTDQELLFTNNETQHWQFCDATINEDAGPSQWYEYDFSGIPAGQTSAVPWNQLRRADGTAYSTIPNEPKIIQLSCVYAGDTIGFARFHD